MLKLYALMNSYAKNEEGATAIEYGLIAALISLAVLAGGILVGPQLEGLFTRIATELQSAGTSS
jgi:pilus assembly protein Flp/PilA